MSICRTICASVVAIAIAGSAHAATVQQVTGEVLASSGGSYKMVKSGTMLEVGDSVFANPGAGGKLVYSDACVVDIVPGTVVIVQAKEPCDAVRANGGQGGFSMVPAIGGIGLAGSIGLAGGIAAAVIVTRSGSKRPSSP